MTHHLRPRFRARIAAFALPALLIACTKPNPLDCTDGTCTDSAFPFCDVDGALAGTPQTCIAVACTAGEFKACRGDAELTCNTTGTDYELTQCAHGCDPGVGCRLCEANQSVCTDGQAQTCDAAGQVTTSQACPLGCFEDQPRCRDVDPSNGLAMYLDMAATAPDLILSDGDFILTGNGTLVHGQTKTTLLSFSLFGEAGGADIRVVIANHVQISGHVRVVPEKLNVHGLGSALAIIANDQITIDGYLDFADNNLETIFPTAGGVLLDGCTGGQARITNVFSSPIQSGSGGGGHATKGGDGGTVGQGDPVLIGGGMGGAPTGNETLVPLRGGCPGGADDANGSFPVEPYIAAGGGALQLSSRTAIKIYSNSILNLNGLPPPTSGGSNTCYGGGAGGGILLEAPTVSLGDSARLVVNGGAACNQAGRAIPTSLTTQITTNNDCRSNSTLSCSQGGNGAALDGPATAGGDIPFTSGPSYIAGGGGGGLGFIRINTATGSYTKESNTIESGVLTTGTIGTR